jgi:hypothetical protein
MTDSGIRPVVWNSKILDVAASNLQPHWPWKLSPEAEGVGGLRPGF